MNQVTQTNHNNNIQRQINDRNQRIMNARSTLTTITGNIERLQSAQRNLSRLLNDYHVYQRLVQTEHRDIPMSLFHGSQRRTVDQRCDLLVASLKQEFSGHERNLQSLITRIRQLESERASITLNISSLTSEVSNLQRQLIR